MGQWHRDLANRSITFVPHSKQRYFDPTNRIYSAALAVLAPELSNGVLGISVANNETRGDICESIMGCVYLAELGLTAADLKSDVLDAVKRVSTVINECSWLCYQLALRVSSAESFQDWICWVVETAAWQKDRPAQDVYAISLPYEDVLIARVKHGFFDVAIE